MANRLDRFVRAQELDYQTAFREIENGCKENHWIWYVFPQLKGLGMSEMSQFYGIEGSEEARNYTAHPVLGPRLEEISTALLKHKGKSAREILGYPDDLKVRSCMTLFDAVAPGSVYATVLDAFYDGQRDPLTLKLLGMQPQT